MINARVLPRSDRAPRSTGNGAAVRAAIAEHDPAVILVDYFDTLVTRVVPKRQVKPIAARHLRDRFDLTCELDDILAARRQAERAIGQRHVDAGLDAEHRLLELGAEVWDLLEARFEEVGQIERDRFAATWEAIELRVEQLAQRVDADVVDAIRPEVGRRRLVIVSDYHTPSEGFANMLAWHGLDQDLFDGLFVSCDSRLSKASGRLFDHVIERLEHTEGPLDRSRILMIGDHPVSDGTRARAAGLRTVAIDRPSEEGRGARLRRPVEASRPARHRVVRQALQAAGPTPFPELAVTLFAFTRRLDRNLRDTDHRILFLAREGRILRLLYDRYRELTPSSAGPDGPSSAYLVVSRRSTAIAGLGPIDDEDFSALLRAYPGISFRDLLVSLGFEPSTIEAVGDDLGPDLDAAADVELLGLNPTFREAFEQRRLEQRQLLHRYIDQVTGRPSGPLTVVDVGWKGTMQDHLQAAVGPERPVDGQYLGIVTESDLASGDRKHGVLFDSRLPTTPAYRVLRHFKSLYEYLLQAGHGSAASYRADSDGSITPVLDDQPREAEVFERHIGPLQDAVVAGFEELCRLDALRTDSLLANLDEVASFHRRMLFFPRRAELDLIRSLEHYENFGRMELVRPEASYPSTAARLRAAGRLIMRPQRVLASGWPPLTMAPVGLGPLIPVVGVYRLVREVAVPRLRRLGRLL